MSLVSNIVVDLASGTVVLTSTVSGNSVENITYLNSGKQVTFSARPDITITQSEFLSFCDQVNIFQTAILFNFNPDVFAIIPFGSCNNTETHDTGLNQWNLVCIYGASPRVCNYSFFKASGNEVLTNRGSSKTLDFPEWQYFLQALNHYRLSIKQF